MTQNSFRKTDDRVKILVFAQHDSNGLRATSLAAMGFARQVAEATGGEASWLLLGRGLSLACDQATPFANALVVDHADLEQPTADRWAYALADVVRNHGFDMVVAASNTLTKDFVPRAAGLLGGAMVSDVVGHALHDGQVQLQRPMFAGAVLATVRLAGTPQMITVQASAYEPAEALAEPGTVEPISVDAAAWPREIEYIRLDSKKTDRPELTEARVVVSGGRAFKNSSDFDRLVGTLADRLGAATGSSRALVDAGITSNDMQVGQTGKIIAPDVYFALGISGAVQHLAGMKNSKVVVAINSDPDAPIFEMADYGLVGNVYEVVPELIAGLES